MDVRIMTISEVAKENEISKLKTRMIISAAMHKGSLRFKFEGNREAVKKQLLEKIDELHLRIYSYLTTIDLIDMGHGKYVFTCDQFEAPV